MDRRTLPDKLLCEEIPFQCLPPYKPFAPLPLYPSKAECSPSYLARTHRIVDMRYTRYPSRLATIVLAVLIYANFFSHHFLPDIRWGPFAAVALLFGRTTVYFRPYRTWRRIPLLLGFGLVAGFIWIAENISTFAHIWTYPNQKQGWHMVGFAKYGAWLLLMIISFILVTLVNPPKEPPVEAVAIKDLERDAILERV